MRDDHFCAIAFNKGLLSPEQIAEALEIQGAISRPQQIGKILVARGYLTPLQVDAILEIQAEARGKTFEPEVRETPGRDPGLLFGAIAVREGLVTEAELREAVRVQRELAAKGDYQRLGEILVRRGTLSRSEVVRILGLQTPSDERAVVTLADAAPLEPVPERGATERVLARVRVLVTAGRLVEALHHLPGLAGDRSAVEEAERLVRRGFLARAAELARAPGMTVKTCDLCETASAVPAAGGVCSRCRTPLGGGGT